MDENNISFLENVPIFRDVPHESLKQILKCSRLVKHDKENVIIRQDDRSSAFYLVLDGKVRIIRYTEEGEELILDILSRGQYFGEMSLLDGMPRSASVVAVTDCALLTIERPLFLKYLQQNIHALEHLLRELCRRLRHADLAIEDISSLDLISRLKKVLVMISKRDGSKVANGYVFMLPTHQDLANMIGGSRARVSEALTILKKKGFIKERGTSFYIQLN